MNIKYIQGVTLAIVFGIQFLFEHVFPQSKQLNDWKNERFNLSIGLLNILLTALPAFGMTQWLNFIADKELGLLNMIHMPFVFQIIASILLLDVWMYTWHVLNHQWRFLWKFHRFHHRDQKMNTTTALRFHIVELLFSYPGKALLCLIVGINFTSLITYECLFAASVIIHHSNIRITEKFDRLYRVMFVSPIMHRIHHSINRLECDHNYGALLSCWDRLFRSWKMEPEKEWVFGVEEVE